MSQSHRASTPARAVAIVATLLALSVVAGCAVGRTGPTPAASTIGHPTGATDLVLRVSVAGGFVPPGFIATEAPGFSLYGDGRLIYRQADTALASPVGGVAQGAAFRWVQLGEPQVQALLADALYTGGLRTAKPEYDLPIADAPTTTFTFDAGGQRGQVSVNGLGLAGGPTGDDASVLSALAALRDRLLAYGATLSTSQAWLSDRYRGYLLDLDAAPRGTAISWPWTTFSPSDWTNVPDESASLPFPTRLMTAAEVGALGLGPLSGGATGIVVAWPKAGGKLFGVSLRPLLPDEAS